MQGIAGFRKMRWAFPLLLLLLLLLILVACQPQEQQLSYETIAQREVIHYRQEQPSLLVIARAEEVDHLTQNVLVDDPRLVESLYGLDYDRVFAILVLHGYVGSTGYSVTVQKITRQGSRVTVRAEFARPAPEAAVGGAFTSPYHLVAVSKEGDWGEQARFALMDGDEPVAEILHLVP